MFRCEYCATAFTRKDNLLRHVMNRHTSQAGEGVGGRGEGGGRGGGGRGGGGGGGGGGRGGGGRGRGGGSEEGGEGGGGGIGGGGGGGGRGGERREEGGGREERGGGSLGSGEGRGGGGGGGRDGEGGGGSEEGGEKEGKEELGEGGRNTNPWWTFRSLVPFQPNSSVCVSGMTGSGKTRWVYRFLRDLEAMYTKDPPQKVLYCYGVYQPLYDLMEQKLSNFTLCSGLPSKEEIDEFSGGRPGLIVLDDLMCEVLNDKTMELLFTQGCHHRNLSVIFITQNLYGQGKSSRTIALNTWYLVLMKNARGASQIRQLGSQLFPGRGDTLLHAYQDATKSPFGYLVVDISPYAEDKLALRTRIFPGEFPITYVPRRL